MDSGYATASNRSSSATTSSLDPASSSRRQSKQSLLRQSLQRRFSSGTHPHPRLRLSDIGSPQLGPQSDNITGQYTPDEFLSEFNAHDQPLLQQESDTDCTDGPVNVSYHKPPHAPPSRCSRAGISSAVPDLGLETCHECGATKLHHLASMSRKTHVALFKEVVKSNLDAIKESDNEGNSCVHFAVGAGASLDQLKILQRGGANVSGSNHNGQTLLHILDPRLYRQTLPPVLLWATEAGLTFFQRDSDGKTPLHHIFGRTIASTDIQHLIPFLEAAPRSMTVLDREGNTPLNILRANWQNTNHAAYLPQLEANLIAHNIPISLRNMSDSAFKRSAQLPDFSKLDISGRDDDSNDILNLLNRSQHESYCQNSASQNVLHTLAAVSFHANYSISCYMNPCGLLECLQQRLENSANVGVDVNQYNTDGRTPLHSFLIATLDINMDIPWLVPECVEMLLQAGADPRLHDRHGNTALHLACSRGRFECVGSIRRYLLNLCSRQQYIRCLSALNDQGKTVIEYAEASMSNEASEADERRKQCIGLVRAAMGEPMFSYMPAAYPSAANLSSMPVPWAMTGSTQLPNQGRTSTPPGRPNSGHSKVLNWPLRTSSLCETDFKMRSAFDFED